MKEYTREELQIVFIDSFTDIEYNQRYALYELTRGKTMILDALKEKREEIISLLSEEKYSRILGSCTREYISFALKELEKRDITAITLASENYPEQLRNIPDSPLVLYAKGDISLLSSKCFSIVGSRRSLPLSIEISKNFSGTLAKAGFTIVTGIAEGADRAAIEGAMERGGKVISIHACGFDNVYPREHTELARAIARNGLILCERPPKFVAKQYHFPFRNRLIAGLSMGTLVISAGIKSGALITANYAADYGKDVFAVPYSVGTESGEGSNALIKSGAMLADSPRDILEFYGVGEDMAAESAEIYQPSDGMEEKILLALKDEELHVEGIAEKTEEEISNIIQTLTMLEIKGVVSRRGTNVFGLSLNRKTKK